MKNSLKCVFPENVATSVTYSGTRLSSKFSKIKDKKNVNEHQHDIVCFVKCPERQYSEDYTGETARRLSKRLLDHNHYGYAKTLNLIFYSMPAKNVINTLLVKVIEITPLSKKLLSLH